MVQWNKPINYDFLEKVLNFSYLNYLYTKLTDLTKQKKYNNLNNKSLKSIVFDFYSSLPKVIIALSADKNNSLDDEFLDYIENANKTCKDINKIKQNMKLLITICEKKELKQVYQRIKYYNINEIEIFFKIQIYVSKIYFIILVNFFQKSTF